jgi:signal transduction histidine kinase
LRLKLEALCGTSKEGTQLFNEISEVCKQAEKLDAEVSLLAWEMRPGVLDSHGLASALNSFVREWSANHGVKAEFHTTSLNKRLLPEVETNLYRIAQEALTNILKHAKANEVTITLSYPDGETLMVIEDDGAGFDHDELAIHTTGGSGFGLVGMHERAVLIGGRLEIESDCGSGTTIIARVPGAAANPSIAKRA